jgi:hypothetical protein
MQHIHLSYYQRVLIAIWIGNHQVQRIQEAAVLLRLLEKIRLTDEELRETQYLQSEPGQVTWKQPSLDYGERDVELESGEAQGLAAILDAAENVRVSDAEWMCRLVEELKGEPVMDAEALSRREKPIGI